MGEEPKQGKAIRLLTARSEYGVEWIEIDSFGTIWWKAEDDGMACGFPVDITFVKDKFSEQGRAFDPSKLPAHAIKHPYAQWLP